MNVWERMGESLWQEFTDLPDAAVAVRVVLRLVVAAVLGGAIGFEREMNGKPAGTRTHMLVALGAALFVLVPQQMKMAEADLSRIIQGMVAGIGFLCAGSILKAHSEEEVHGLTTAAGLWLTAAVGMTIGLGRVGTAVMSTAFALVILGAMPQMAQLFQRKKEPPKNAGASKE